MDDLTAEQREALKIAARMIDAGVPIFAAAPNPDRPGEYYLPKEWEKTVPSHVWLEKWRPGWALGAVGGHAADFLDFDPRNGGHESRRELEIQGQMPRSFGTQRTPSGGTHEVISPTGERKGVVMPGVDLQSGAEQPVHGSHGRGFVFIAPTVRPSKAPETLGELHAYRWEVEPDLDYLTEFPRGTDDTVEGIVARVHAKRSKAPERNAFTEAAGDDPLFGGHSGPRLFTQAEAEAFCLPFLEALERAPIGEIEERANTAAAALYHFVGSHWNADQAYAVLLAALEKTAYDPDHPASSWTAEKFMAVLDGRRPPLDSWKAEARLTHEEAAKQEPAEDAVEALLAEMVRPSTVRSQSPPAMLVQGLLTMNSESWLIGAPGSKKSFVATDIAAHVAAGMPWHGLKVRQGPVVMIVAEGAGGLGPRVKAWEAQNGHPMSDDIHILPRPVQASNAGAWAVLRKACERLSPALVIIDTQARVTVGLEENSAKEMGVYIEAVRSIREATGACVLSVHHTGRSGGDARGSSAIDGAQTTELKVESTPGALRGKLKSEKQKDLQLAPDVELHFKVHTVGVDDDGLDITSLALRGQVSEVELAAEAGQEEQDALFAESLEPWKGKVPEDWTKSLVAAQAKNKRRILQVLHDHAGSYGLTESKILKAVTDRWEKPSDTGWIDAWSAVRDLDCVINISGERWILDRIEAGLE